MKWYVKRNRWRENNCSLFGSAPFTHDLCEQDFLTRDVMTETAQDEEENSPSDCDGRPEMGVTRV